MSKKKVLPCGSIVVGVLFGLAGLSFILIYVLEAIISRLGEPDQSLIFWYLPFLLFGLIGIIIGTSGVVYGLNRLKQLNQRDSNDDEEYE